MSVLNPKQQSEAVDVVFNNDRTLTYACTYVPKMEGLYTVHIKFAGRTVQKSPFNVSVEGFAGDPSKVIVSGPGIQPDGIIVNVETYFDIIGKGAGIGAPEVEILDPKGHRNAISCTVSQTSTDTWRCFYVTPILGLHSINVFFAGQQIPHSPFGVRVAPGYYNFFLDYFLFLLRVLKQPQQSTSMT